MKFELIMLDTPIIVSDEKVSDVDPEFFYCAKDKDWYKYSPDQYEELEKEDRPIIAGLPELPQIDGNNLEDEFVYVDVEKLAKQYDSLLSLYHPSKKKIKRN